MTDSALPPLTFTALALPQGRELLQAETNLEAWSIAPAMMGNPARIAHFLTDGRKFVDIIMHRSFEDLKVGSHEFYRHASLRRSNLDNHGYADTQADAVALTEILRSGDTTGNVAELLSRAGFVREPNNGYRPGTSAHTRKIGRNYFTMYVSESHVHLIFERSGWTHWENLARFNQTSTDGKNEPVPVFWPQRVADNFQVLAVQACVSMVERYIADGRMTADRRRKFQPR